MKRIRILYQVFFFGLFLFLLAVMDLTYMKGYPVRWFIQIDPLVSLATALSAHTLYHGLVWCLPTVLVTVLFGRVFCGWICPFGTLHHFSGAWLDARSRKDKIEANRYRPLSNLKYYLLTALLVMAAGGSLQIGWLDPIPFLTRAMAVFVQPMSQHLGQALGLDAAGSGFAAVLAVLSAAALGWIASKAWTRSDGAKSRTRNRKRYAADALLAAVLAAGVLFLFRYSPVEQRRFHWGFWITLLFLLLLVLNRFVPRFFCRALCPLGATLGLVAKHSLFQIHRDPKTCLDCEVCVADCQGACDPDGLLRKSECFVCLNCRDACPEGSISYRFLPPLETPKDVPAPTNSPAVPASNPNHGLDRRRVMGAAALGALWVLGVRTGGGDERTAPRDLVRPPGSLAESEFLERCLKCGACMKVCPTNAIQPALAEGGFEGLWTPILLFRVGSCELECTLCGQVCPTGAIRSVTRDEKLGLGAWQGRPLRIGTAFFDRGRCLPWAMGVPCVVCQEVCPVSPKAIFTKPTEFTRRDGTTVTLDLPHVDPGLCTGCGICETECPVHDLRAIRISSVGETRSTRNRMLLGNTREIEKTPPLD